MTVSVDQQAALEKPVARDIYFVKLEFVSGIQYMCTAGQTIPWDGHDWLGFGAVAAISPVEESDGLESKALNFTINVADPGWLALAIGPVEDYRNRPATMYMCPLNENFQMVDTPVQCWSGTMDMITPGADAEGNGQIILKCETSANGLKRRPGLRLNHAQQKQRYPTDTGFQYLEDLIANPVTWLSRKFQQIR